MGILYASGGKIFCNDYMEIYIPMEYFENGVAANKGASIETLGILYTREFSKGIEGPIRLLNIPVVIDVMVYESKNEYIKIGNKRIAVMTLQYLKDSYVLHQTLEKGREVAGSFLGKMLQGKLPKTIEYTKVIDVWWKNLTYSGISYKVPSKIYEMIIASIYRNPHNLKERYGQLYGKQSNPTGYDYTTANVREVVKNLSTFSGMVFEDIGNMITSGINNTAENVDEAVSPLEKVIYY